MIAKILSQYLAEIFFCRIIGRPVVIGEIEMCLSPVEGTADNGAPGLKNIFITEVLP
jgi:hypothetical protein